MKGDALERREVLGLGDFESIDAMGGEPGADRAGDRNPCAHLVGQELVKLGPALEGFASTPDLAALNLVLQ